MVIPRGDIFCLGVITTLSADIFESILSLELRTTEGRFFSPDSLPAFVTHVVSDSLERLFQSYEAKRDGGLSARLPGGKFMSHHIDYFNIHVPSIEHFTIAIDIHYLHLSLWLE